MTTIYIAFDSADSNNFITASISKSVCAWGIVEYLERNYTAEEWEGFLTEDGYLSNEDMVRNIIAGLDDVLKKFGITLREVLDKGVSE